MLENKNSVILWITYIYCLIIDCKGKVHRHKKHAEM